MEKFIASNPGFASRFNKYIEFHDYNREELFQIFEYTCTKNSYNLDAVAAQIHAKIIMNMQIIPDELSTLVKSDIIRYIKIAET